MSMILRPTSGASGPPLSSLSRVPVALTRSAWALAPANAHAEVRSRAHYVTRARGGAGAVREACDLLLQASGHYTALLAPYLPAAESPAP